MTKPQLLVASEYLMNAAQEYLKKAALAKTDTAIIPCLTTGQVLIELAHALLAAMKVTAE